MTAEEFLYQKCLSLEKEIAELKSQLSFKNGTAHLMPDWERELIKNGQISPPCDKWHIGEQITDGKGHPLTEKDILQIYPNPLYL